MEYKGQGALEYLLLIGGAILVAVIVIALIVGLGSSGGTEASQGAADALCAKYPITPSETLCTDHTNLAVGSVNYDCIAKDTDGDGSVDSCRAEPV